MRTTRCELGAAYEPAYSTQRASHAFILTLRREAKGLDVTAMDIAKRWLDDVRAAKHLDLTWKPVQ